MHEVDALPRFTAYLERRREVDRVDGTPAHAEENDDEERHARHFPSLLPLRFRRHTGEIEAAPDGAQDAEIAIAHHYKGKDVENHFGVDLVGTERIPPHPAVAARVAPGTAVLVSVEWVAVDLH